MWMAMLFAQAVSGPVLPAASAPHMAQRCPTDLAADEIVVCARDPDRFRLKAPATAGLDREGLPKAEVRLGSAALAAEAEQATLAGGAQSQRMMVRLKIPFGKKKDQQ